MSGRSYWVPETAIAKWPELLREQGCEVLPFSEQSSRFLLASLINPTNAASALRNNIGAIVTKEGNHLIVALWTTQRSAQEVPAGYLEGFINYLTHRGFLQRWWDVNWTRSRKEKSLMSLVETEVEKAGFIRR